MEMQITDVNHITLVVSDLGRAIGFYRDILGFEPVRETAKQCYLQSGTVWLCLEKVISDVDLGPAQGDDSHIALSVQPQNFDRARDLMEAHKVHFWKDNKSEGASLYILDPDGHRLELHVGSLESRMMHYALDQRNLRPEKIDLSRVMLYITGLPGSGKKTIASYLSACDDRLKLVDNHLINNPIFQLLNPSDMQDLPQVFWEAQDQIWQAVLTVMDRVANPDTSYILTNALYANDPEDHEWFNVIARMAVKRGAVFIPVFLSIDRDVHKERIASKGREMAYKISDPAFIDQFHAKGGPLTKKASHALYLDVSHKRPEEAACDILSHIQSLKG